MGSLDGGEMTAKIEFLEAVDIRKVWSREDKNFTPWIADPEVTAKLLEQCQIDYDGELTIQTEVTLPGYKRKLDVLVESSSGDRIAIENQFNEADHDHMTRALAYAVGLEAKVLLGAASAVRFRTVMREGRFASRPRGDCTSGHSSGLCSVDSVWCSARCC